MGTSKQKVAEIISKQDSIEKSVIEEDNLVSDENTQERNFTVWYYVYEKSMEECEKDTSRSSATLNIQYIEVEGYKNCYFSHEMKMYINYNPKNDTLKMKNKKNICDKEVETGIKANTCEFSTFTQFSKIYVIQ